MTTSRFLSLPEAILQANQLANSHSPQDIAAATTLCTQVLAVDPDNSNAYYLLGKIEYNQQNLDAAARHLERALELNPNADPILTLYGIVCFRQNKFEKAINTFHSSVLLHPDNSESRINLAKAFQAVNRFDEAKEQLDRAIDISPVSAEARYILATVYLATCQYDKAILECDEALKLSPADSRAHYYRAIALHRLGDMSASNSSYLECLTLQPKFEAARFGLASNFRDQGDFSAATREFKKLETLAPNYPNLSRQLGELQALRDLQAQTAVGSQDISPLIVMAPVGRCGSTLLQRVLNSSNSLLIYGENLDLTRRLPESVEFSLSKFSSDTSDLTAADLKRLNQEWSAGLMPGKGCDYLDLALDNFYRITQHYAQSARALGRRWGLKEPYAGQIGTLRWLLPNARFIFIYRDLLDVARSYKGRGWIKTDFDAIKLAHDWQEGIRSAFLCSHAPNVLLVKYENLLHDPKHELARLSAFAEVDDLDEKILDVRVNAPDANYREPQNLTDKERELIECHGGALRRWLNYA